MTGRDLRGTAVTARLAGWIAETAGGVVPSAVADQVRRAVLDYHVAAIGGAAESVPAAVRNHVKDTDRSEIATLAGGGRASAANAAFVNGTAAHALEIDDGYTAGGSHPGAATLPAVFAQAQAHDSSPGTVLTAAAVALEVACLVAAAGHPESRRRGFHNTSNAGVFGAAAGCAVILGLPEPQIASALGLAGSHASGLFEFLAAGDDSKQIHPGIAARNGLVSADLAARGLTGPHTVLEGVDGYFASRTGGDWSPGPFQTLRSAGRDWSLLQTYVKLHPCCRHLHGAIDAVLGMRDEWQREPGRIDRIEVATYAIAARHDSTDVASALSARLSLPYAVAVAVSDGRVGLEQFAAARRADPTLLDLAQRVVVRVDDEFDAVYPTSRPARVMVTFDSGRSYRRTVLDPLGEPSTPISDERLVRKAHDICDGILTPAGVEHLVEAARSLDVIALAALLGSGRSWDAEQRKGSGTVGTNRSEYGTGACGPR